MTGGLREILSQCVKFVGRRTIVHGLGGLCTGFLTFLFDMLLAACLQRFFMATGLVTAGSQVPLGFDLGAPVREAAFLITIAILRGLVFWLNGHQNGLCQTAIETEKRAQITAWAIRSGKEEIGTVANLYNDVVLGAAATVQNVFYVAGRVIMLAGLLGVMSWYSVFLTGLVLLLIVAIAPLQLFIDMVVSRNAKRIQQSLASSLSRLTSAVKNNLFIHLHDLVAPEVNRIEDQISIYRQSTERYFALSSFRTVLPQILGLVAVCAIAIKGRELFAENQGNLVAFLYLIIRLFQCLSDLARISGNVRLNAPRVVVLWRWWRTAQQADALRPLSSLQQSQLCDAPVGWRAENLGFAYAGGRDAVLSDVSFDIKPGSLALLSGPSGAGKSTLLQMLVGLLLPTSGQLLWMTKEDPVAKPLDSRLPARMAYVGPEPFLVAGSLRDQLLLGQEEIIPDQLLAQALVAAQAEFALSLPGGLDYTLTEQGGGLSAGQKQRLSLARALLRRPSVLLLDEATANLDPETETAVFATVHALRGTMTILVVSHRPPRQLVPDLVIELSPKAKTGQQS